MWKLVSCHLRLSSFKFLIKIIVKRKARDQLLKQANKKEKIMDRMVVMGRIKGI